MASVANGGQRIAFHRDHAQATLNVALNGDSEYAGGKLMFAFNGAIVCPARPTGSALMNDNTIVHGVSQLTGGVRYGLFVFIDDMQGSSEADFHGFPFCLEQVEV